MASPTGLLKALAKGARIGKPIEQKMGDVTANLGSDVLDMGLLAQRPNVEQGAIDLYQPPRGMPGTLENILTKDAAERLAGYARKGAETGGLEWYNLEPLRQQFIDRLGPDAGIAEFNRFADFVAATSPRSTVANNIRRASLFQSMERNNQPFSGLSNADMPTGYGHIAHETQMSLLNDLAGGGHFSGQTRPKTSSFAENLKGNWAPLTSDTHNMSAIVGDPKTKVSPSKTQYPYVQGFQSDIADKLGITPAQMQASVWMGGETGVADARPFIQVFDDVVKRTAAKNKTTPEQVLHDFIVNGKPLWGMAALSPLIAQLKGNKETSVSGGLLNAGPQM